jgi:hypothetical protein
MKKENEIMEKIRKSQVENREKEKRIKRKKKKVI